MYKKILVPVDGSRFSNKAIKEAARLGKALGSKLVLFHVLPPYQMPIYSEGMALPHESRQEFEKKARARAHQVLAAAAKQANALGASCASEFTVSAAPWEAIIAAAKKYRCDLIVMASHGRGGLSALLLGSETQKVLTHSSLPVLVVR